MVVVGIGIHGLAGLAEVRAEGLGRVVRVGGPVAALDAFRLALDLAFSAFTPQSTRGAFERLGCPAEGDDELTLTRPERVRPLVADQQVKIRLHLELDPPQFGRLRELAVRDPDLVDALADPHLAVTLGWAFTNDFEVVSCSRMGVELGGVRLDAAEHTWLPGFLSSLDGRGGVHRPLALDVDRIAAAERSPKPADRVSLAALRRDLARAPLAIGELHVVEVGERWLALGDDLVPLAATSQTQAVALAAAVHLSGAEILAFERPSALCERPRAVRNWLEAQSTRAGSPLEQVFVLGEGAPDLVVGPPVDADAPGLRFPT